MVVVRCTDIEYDIEEEDVDVVDEEFTDHDELVEEAIQEIVFGLPTELTFSIPCSVWEEEEDKDYYLADKISDKTGWLIYGFNYDILANYKGR